VGIYLKRGLALLPALPETPARVQQELEMQLALGAALIVTQGMAVPKVEQTYARARALCYQVGETPHLFPTLLGCQRFYANRGVLPTAQELERALSQICI
jgi:predicted ATPase